MSWEPQSWEILAAAAAGVAALAARLVRPRAVAHPRVVAFQQLLQRPRVSMLLDWALAIGALLVIAFPLWALWGELLPMRAPKGPDASMYLGSALAFETGQPELYFPDRYPAYPWLVSLYAPTPMAVPWAGTTLSMVLTCSCAIPLYWIGRQLAGRTAGLVGAVLALRQALAIDVGRSFTHYPLAALLDLSLLALALAFCAQGALWAAGAIGLTGALAVASDPKQIPLVVGALALCSVAALMRKTTPVRRLLPLPLLWAPLPITDVLVRRAGLELLSLEGVLIRTPLQIDGGAIRAHVDDGYALGGVDSWANLLPSFWRVLRDVGPKADGVLDPQFVNGLQMTLPNTSLIWLVPLLALPILVARTSPRRFSPLLLLLFWASAGSALRLHYAHRYVLPHALLAGPSLSASIGLALGPAALLGGGLVAALHPDSPVAPVDAQYLRRQVRNTDIWVGKDNTNELRALDWAINELPADTAIFDFSTQRPSPIFAAAFPYARCSHANCGKLMEAHAGEIVAIVWARDFVSGQLPGGEREPIVPVGRTMPPHIGSCWIRARVFQPDSALYRWTCDARPEPWPDQQTAPRPNAP